MNKSESIAKLAKALAVFQSEVINPKNSAKNPFFSSAYCPLNDLLNLVRPLLSKHGLSVLQSPGGDGTNIVISTILMHESGEWIEPEPLVLKADKATAQGAGSAITYGRRYALSAILGISSEDDDDGNHASNNKPSNSQQQSTGQRPQNQQPQGSVKLLSSAQKNLINKLFTDKNISEIQQKALIKEKVNKDSVDKLTPGEASKLIEYLQKAS